MHVCFVVSLDLTFTSLNFTIRMSSVGTDRKMFCGVDDTFDCRLGQRFFFFESIFRPPLGYTQAPKIWVLRTKGDFGAKVTTYFSFQPNTK